MTRGRNGDAPVVVVGGGLAGMAAAARLAKLAHPVRLLEATDRLGGSWAPYEVDGVMLDRAPGVLGFPAPWRDLFRKSGRPLEAELARTGLALVPGPPTDYVFADGSHLTLPTDRGQQYEVLTEAYGGAAAGRWRDLVDGLGAVWQAVRPLGLEAELRDRGQLVDAKAVLRPRRTIRQLADELGEPHLAAVVASIAYRLGSRPERTPAWCAVELSVQRTFGRWVVVDESSPNRTGRSSLLVEALAARLALRKVDVGLGTRVVGLTAGDEHLTGVLTAAGEQIPAAAVVCSNNPWDVFGGLWPDRLLRSRRRALRRWQPALAPTVSQQLSTDDQVVVSESVTLTADGVPTVRYVRPTPAGAVYTVHDFAHASRARSAGIAWDGFRSWLDRPPVTTELAGLFTAGPFSPGGSAPSSVILSGALASYACHDYLS